MAGPAAEKDADSRDRASDRRPPQRSDSDRSPQVAAGPLAANRAAALVAPRTSADPVNDPVRRAALRQIQQTYGNRAAQRVVSNRGQATADTAARPPGTHGVQPAGAANRSSGESEDRAVAATTSVRPTGSAERQPGTAPTSARAPRTAARGRGAAGADTHGPAAASSEHQAPASRDAPRVAVEQTGKPTEPAVDEPFRLDPPEPLAVAPILIAFPAPASLAVEALRFPALPPQAAEAGADKNRSAADAAREAYADAARGARAKYESLLGESNAAVSGLATSYDVAIQRGMAMFLGFSSELDLEFDGARARIDASAKTAEVSIDTAANEAKRLINGASSGALGRIAKAFKDADGQIDKLLDEITDPFKKTITDAKAACTTSGDAAVAAVNGWRTSFEQDLKLEGSAVMKARAEAKRKAAPKVIDDESKLLTDTLKKTKETYDDTGTKTSDQVRKNARPPMDQYKNRINTEGRAAVNRSHSQALKQLTDQSRDARNAVRDMHANAAAQAVAQRRAARSRLRGVGENFVLGLRSETDAALRGIQNATRASLAMYEKPITRLADTMARSAEQGPDQLQAVVRTAPRDIDRTLTSGRRQQSDRLETNQREARSSLDRRENQARQDGIGEVIAARTDFGEAVSSSATAMRDTAAKHAAAFSQSATSIARTADGWTKPFSVVFAQYVKDAIAHNKEPHQTWAAQVNKGKDDFVAFANRHVPPAVFFEGPLEPVAQSLEADLSGRVDILKRELFATFNTTESAVTGALHNLTPLMGAAIEELFGRTGRNLRSVLRFVLWDDDYNACINYLNGDPVAGARYELKASIHWYNDEESRIEKVMRDLTPEQRARLGDTEMGRDAVADTRSALGGTDLDVFNALMVGNDARADAYQMRDKLQEAREKGDVDAINAVLAEYSKAPQNWAGRNLTADERRQQVQREFAAVLDNVAADKPAAVISQKDAEDRVLKVALADMQVVRDRGDQPELVTVKVEGAQRDLGEALVRKGEASLDARVARLGVEIQRPGKPNVTNLETALIDPRLNPNNRSVSPQDIQQALKERQQMFEQFGQRYLPADQSRGQKTAQQRTEEAFRGAFGDEHLKADLASGWIKETHPSPATAALAMRVAINGLGTDEALAFRTVERMNRDEIAQMRQAYREQTTGKDDPEGRDLWADLGVFGHKRDWFNEFSGDEALQLEVKLLGQPRNDKERAEVSFLQAQQQMNETGALGKWLASGTVAEADLKDSYARLRNVTGGSVSFDDEGTPRWTGGALFDDKGHYTGKNRRELENAIQLTTLASQSYAAKIDSYANAATMAVAIIGAIVAAAVTVATGGAASPLLIAAIAGISGLAGIGLHAAISGGRYGWEQAAVDLGMTAVQALTAGVGQSLGLASRGGAAAVKAATAAGIATKAGQITGSAFADMVLIGAATGGLHALGTTALSERTWSKDAEFAVDQLLEGLLKGIVSGAATAAVTQAFEAIPVSKAVGGLPRETIGSKMGAATNPALRGGLKTVSSAVGGFTGRAADLTIDKATGQYRGDAGDIFQASGEAAAHSAVQGLGEGIAEAPAHARFERQQDRIRQAQTRGAGAVPGDEGAAPIAARPAATTQPEIEPAAVPRPGSRPELEPMPQIQPSAPQAPAAEPSAPRAAALEAPTEAGPTPRPSRPQETPPTVPAKPARQATVEESFADFDALIKELRDSPFGYDLEAAKRRAAEPLREDPTRTREQVDAAAHAAARREPPEGRVPGAQIQHQTKTLDVTVKLPPGMRPLHPDVINENLLWLQSRTGLPATLVLVDPAGRPTRYFVDDVPRGRVGDPGARDEQLDLFGKAARPREPDYSTEHKFMDNYLIPAAAAEIAAARRRAGLPPLDPRMLAIAAGEQTRWVMAGTTGSSRSGATIALGREPRQMLLAPEVLSPELARLGRTVDVEPLRPAARTLDPRQTEMPFDRPDLSRQMVMPIEGVDPAAPTRPAPTEPIRSTEPSRVPDHVESSARQPARTEEQAAAGITGTRFTGDAAQRLNLPEAHLNHVVRAVDALMEPGGLLAGKLRVPDETRLTQLELDTRAGGPVSVRIETEADLPRSKSGEIPVAQYEQSGENAYVIRISKGAPADVMNRALAHELAEIRAAHRTTGSLEPALAAGSKVRELTPHDEGRLAEVAVLAQQLKALPPDAPGRARILDDAQRLAAHLGLTGEGPAVDARRTLAREAVGDGPARALLDDAIATAGGNPFLQRLTGELVDDITVIARRIEHAQSIGEPDRAVAALRRESLEIAQQLVTREGLVGKPVVRRVTRNGRVVDEVVALGGFSKTRVAHLQEALSPSARALLDQAIKLAGAVREPAVGAVRDPGDLDAHTVAATRRLFGDQERFQEWSAFRDQYLASYPNLDGNNPLVLRRLFEQWAAGSYFVHGTGRARSLLSGMERPSPGYEHRFLTDPVAHEDLTLPADQILRIGKGEDARTVTVEGAVAERDQHIAAAQARRDLLQKTTDPETRARLVDEINALIGPINQLSEALGVAAGRAYALDTFPGAQTIEMHGSGVPDLILKLPDGRIVVIECKGGLSDLGTRLSVDGTVRVEQGTREYLISLATEMSQSSDPTKVDWGRALLKQLNDPTQDTQYFVVRQPFDAAGQPASPDVGEFDTSRRTPQ